MKRSAYGDEYTLTSGRIVHAHRGIFGLTPELDELTHGYDGIVERIPEPWEDLDDEESPLTHEERKEIADFQIALWREFAEKGLRRKED